MIVFMLGILIFFLVNLVMIKYEEFLIKWFAKGISLKNKYDDGDFEGQELKNVFAFLFKYGFLLADLYMRLTIIVIRFNEFPKLELVTTYIARITQYPVYHPTWKIALAVYYRIDIIEPIDPDHFKGVPNNAMNILEQRLEKWKGESK